MRVRGSAIIVQEQKILVLRYVYPKGTVYAIPGGGLEPGESLDETLVREFREELSLEIELGPLQYVSDMMPQGKIPQTLHVVFLGNILSGEPKLNPEHTSAAGFEWLPLEHAAGKKLYPALPIDAAELAQEQATPRYLGKCIAREWA